MKFSKIFLLLFILTIFRSWGQAPINEIKVGDKVPEVVLSHIIRSPKTSAKLSDFRGKVLLLDFYATWCVPCIKVLPQLDSLQKIFKDQLVVLPVAYQKEAVVQESFKFTRSLKGVTLPVVVEDTILQKLFPHHTVPHDVVIDQNGIVKAITDNESINASTLKSFIDGKDVRLKLKEDVMNFDYTKPFFLDDKGIELLKYEFLITGSYEGVPSRDARFGETKQHGDTRLCFSNDIILNLYRTAFLHKLSAAENIPVNRVVFDHVDTTMFISPALTSPDRNKWEGLNTYCVDLTVPVSQSDRIYEILKNGLDNYFNLNTRLETREMKCLILKKQGEPKYISTVLKPRVDKDSQLWTFEKVPLGYFLWKVNYKSNLPIVDETDYAGNVDISISPDVNDVDSLRKQLNAYGLDLVQSTRKLQVMVIANRTP